MATPRYLLRLIEDDLVESLKGDATGWDFSTRDDGHVYRAVNETMSASIWLSNGHYGLGYSAGRFSRGEYVTVASAFFGWATPWRRRLRAAAMGAYRRRPQRVGGWLPKPPLYPRTNAALNSMRGI